MRKSTSSFFRSFLLLLIVLARALERDGDLINLAKLLNGDEVASSKLFTDAHCREGNCFFKRLISSLYPWIIGNPPGEDISFKLPEVSTIFCRDVVDSDTCLVTNKKHNLHILSPVPLCDAGASTKLFRR